MKKKHTDVPLWSFKSLSPYDLLQKALLGTVYFLYLPVKKLYKFCIWGLSLKYDFERQLQTRSATSVMNSLVAGLFSLFTFKFFWIKAWNLPPRASKVSLSKLGQLFADPLQVNAVSKKPRMIDNLAKFGSGFASSSLKTSTTEAMSFKGKLELASIVSSRSGYPLRRRGQPKILFQYSATSVPKIL